MEFNKEELIKEIKEKKKLADEFFEKLPKLADNVKEKIANFNKLLKNTLSRSRYSVNVTAKECAIEVDEKHLAKKYLGRAPKGTVILYPAIVDNEVKFFCEDKEGHAEVDLNKLSFKHLLSLAKTFDKLEELVELQILKEVLKAQKDRIAAADEIASSYKEATETVDYSIQKLTQFVDALFKRDR